jgi:hypothetical protein
VLIQRDCLSALIAGEQLWKESYDISFTHRDNHEQMQANLLFAGTNQVSPERMMNIYDKSPNQEERYCVVACSMLTDLLRLNQRSVICKLLQRIDKKEIPKLRFVRLGKK